MIDCFLHFPLAIFPPSSVSNFLSMLSFAHMLAGKQKRTCKQTHTHKLPHYIAQSALISSVDTQGRCTVSFQCSGSDELQLLSWYTHTGKSGEPKGMACAKYLEEHISNRGKNTLRTKWFSLPLVSFQTKKKIYRKQSYNTFSRAHKGSGLLCVVTCNDYSCTVFS